MSVLKISLFGHVQIEHDGWKSEIRVPPIAQALFSYLLLKRDHYHHRETLADLFWGEYSRNRAGSCLSTALWRLRRVLEPEGVPKNSYLVTTAAGEVGFNWESSYWLDVEAFEQGVTQILKKSTQSMTADDAQNLEEMLNLCTNNLLEGFYDDWVIHERERFRQLYLNSMEHLMYYYKHQEVYKRSLACGQRILDHDPLRESIHREMMRLYWENGQSVRAVRQYQTCREILAKELAIEPMEETQVLFATFTSTTAKSDAASIPHKNLTNLQKALNQLHLATQEFEIAQKKLNQAIQLVEQFTLHHHEKAT